MTKVLHITYSSKGGAGIAALRLHNALHENNVSSGFLSVNLTIDFNNTKIKDPFFSYNKPSFFKKIINKIKTIFFQTTLKRENEKLKKIKKGMNYEIVSLPYSSFQLNEHPLVNQADIIHLHWISGIIDYPSFFENLKKPIVWTLHDMNPIQGLFHYKNDEIRNLAKIVKLNTEVKNIKLKATDKIQKCIIVTPSSWLQNEVEKSDFFNHFPKFTVSNSVDLETFKIQDKNELRKKYLLNNEEFIMLFVSEDVSNFRKGFDLLLQALNIIKNLKITVLTIGKNEFSEIENLKIVSMGKINSSNKMSEFYALADLFVLPSREDNLPNVMLESFACGTPIVGFNVGGIKEHTIENLTGLLADKLNPESLAKTIEKFIQTKDQYKSEKIRKYAEEHFNFKKQALSYIQIYNQLIQD